MANAPSHGSVSPVVLVILDGWGHREASDGNAILNAKSPVMDSLWAAYPHTLINASGKDVGLPAGQMGNSEVGHLNIGAGRVVAQELVRISEAVEDGSLRSNPQLVDLCQTVRNRQGKLHLMGLCSDGGVHSHLQHLLGLIDLAKAEGLSEICVHAITDGRDTKPMAAKGFLETLQAHLDHVGVGRIVTLAGRYYAMDRDRRWDRIQKAYDVLIEPGEGLGQSAVAALQASYDAGHADEFVLPVRLAAGAIEPGDGVIFFNFRPDRSRQLVAALIEPAFKDFERELIPNLEFVTFTQYDESLPAKVAFAPQTYHNILGEVISRQGLKQFRAAETEKYPHVTYFFDGGVEKQFEGLDQRLVLSPQVSTYDRAPAMSAEELTDVVIEAIETRQYSLIVMNYANPDMVGHTGNLEAAVAAIEAVDQCVGRLMASVGAAGGTAIITADHGNAEYMRDEDGNPWTAHTSNQVPFILVEGEGRKIPGHGTDVQLRENRRLSDIAPTILEILQIPQPVEMTGRSIIQPLEVEMKRNRTPVRLGAL